MQTEKHKVFISFHHDNDQWAKDYLLTLNYYHDIFFDRSVATDDISDDLLDRIHSVLYNLFILRTRSFFVSVNFRIILAFLCVSMITFEFPDDKYSVGEIQ